MWILAVQDAANQKGASDSLRETANSFGKEGEGGPNIAFKNLKPGVLGRFQGNEISLDPKQIGDTAREVKRQNGISTLASIMVVGAAVLGHEGRHNYEKNWTGGDDRIFGREVRGYMVTRDIMSIFGVSGLGYDKRHGRYEGVRRDARQDCINNLTDRGKKSYTVSAAQAKCG